MYRGIDFKKCVSKTLDEPYKEKKIKVIFIFTQFHLEISKLII